MEPQEDPCTLKEQKLSIENRELSCTATSSWKIKKEYKTESLKEVNKMPPAGPNPHQAAEGREAIYRMPEV